MAPIPLCDVCSHVPAWLGSKPWDGVYYRHDPPITLRSFVEMRAEIEKGPGAACHLCQLIYKAADGNEGWRPIEGKKSDYAWVNTPFVMRRWWNRYDRHYEFVCENMSRLYMGEIWAAPLSWQPRHSPLLGYKERIKYFNVKLMNDWLDNCRRNHHYDCQPAFRDFLPTRLLDVEAFNSNSNNKSDADSETQPPPWDNNPGNDIKLVSANDVPCDRLLPPPYLTLSHCWGPPEKRPTMTTKKTLAQRMERIPFSDLPPTFQEAVDVTRQLGQRYLWIDSLCIVQDDKDDWGREAGLMSKVYSQAYCTLAALNAKDSTEGLRVQNLEDVQKNMGPFLDLMVPWKEGSSYQVRIWASVPRHWMIAYYGKNDSSPLLRRAWTLQEWLLSRRTIFFGADQLLWECRTHRGSAELPWWGKGDGAVLSEGAPPEEWQRDEWSELQRTQSEVAAIIASSRETVKRWWQLVADYSDRFLTKDTDKLAALSGVARYHQKDFPDATYVAGMWSSHLPEALLWIPGSHVDPPVCNRPSEYVAPSWSWASFGGPAPVRIEYILIGSPIDEYKKKFARPAQSVPEEKMCDELKVEEINILHKYDDPYGPLKGANLVLSGARLVDVELVTEPFDGPPHHPDSIIGRKIAAGGAGWSTRYTEGLKRDGMKFGDHRFDVASEEEEEKERSRNGGGRLWCLAIRALTLENIPRFQGLLLREEEFDGTMFTYSRVGRFETVQLSPVPFSIFSSMEPRRIKLI
ncbi:HET domain protein pin-c2 [Sordaria sp. MPI-SDFR-AT-0083]|nr:HET domain protein pin-c2 [Sordaria sp. MPI-SDFR-AT-0083]